jgi:hypothetical protein
MLTFQECGWTAWLCLLIGLVGVGAGLLGFVLLGAKVRVGAWIAGGAAIVLGVTAVGAGLLGQQLGLRATESAVAGESVDASQKARILAVGAEEAAQCVKVGAAAGALPLVMGALAVGIGLALRQKTAS